MVSYVLEIVIFKVKPEFKEEISSIRSGLREVLEEFPGLLEFRAFTPLSDKCYADVVKWENHECALAAGKAIASGDQRFVPYMQAIDTITFMGHFCPDET